MDWMGDKKDIVRILVRLSFCSVESHTMHQSNAFLRQNCFHVHVGDWMEWIGWTGWIGWNGWMDWMDGLDEMDGLGGRI